MGKREPLPHLLRCWRQLLRSVLLLGRRCCRRCNSRRSYHPRNRQIQLELWLWWQILMGQGAAEWPSRATALSLRLVRVAEQPKQLHKKHHRKNTMEDD